MAQEITPDYILSEDGKFVIGKKNRTDSHGKPLPEMYKRRIPVKNMQNLVAGKQTPEQAAKARESTARTYGDRYEKFYNLLEKGHSRSRSAKLASIPWGTIRERMKADPTFEAAIEDAEMVATDVMYDMVYKTILETENVERGMAWLGKRDKRFADKRVTEQTVTQRLELPGVDRIEAVMELAKALGARRELAEGNGVIDVESTEK